MDAKRHYINHGNKEKRKYKIDKSKLPEDFIWSEYVSLNSDLSQFNEVEATHHYINYGKNEGRVYKK